jgi:hypothetical protein
MFQTYVSSVPSGCCICFYGSTHMFQVFHMFHTYVPSVYLDVAYVAMPIHACFKCFIYFRRILQMFQKSAGGCRCYWGVAMSQPTWVFRAGHGPATDAGSGAWAGCGHGTWGRMRARELHRCGSRLRTSRLGLPFTLSSNRSRGGCVFSRFVSISIVHSACNDNDINGKSTFCHLCSKSLLSFEK